FSVLMANRFSSKATGSPSATPATVATKLGQKASQKAGVREGSTRDTTRGAPIYTASFGQAGCPGAQSPGQPARGVNSSSPPPIPKSAECVPHRIHQYRRDRGQDQEDDDALG